MVAVRQNDYTDINITLTSQSSCEAICKKIENLIQLYTKDQNPKDLILNISIKRVTNTVDQNIQKIDISR